MPGIAPEWSSADDDLSDLAAVPGMADAVSAAREALRTVDPDDAVETMLAGFTGEVRQRLEGVLRRA